MSSTNWKNVNNWHWTSKNCLKWAIEYYKTQIELINLKDVSISFIELKGDCDLNHRKGKVLSIFDLKLNLKLNSDKINGELEISEICHDSDVGDYIFEWKGNIDKVIKEDIISEIKKIILKFQRALIDQHSKDVKLPKEENKTTPVVVPTKTNNNQKNGDIDSFKIEHVFYTKKHDLYKVLTDAKLIHLWSKKNTTFVAAPNLPFKLLDQHFKGTINKVIKDELIQLNWRDKDWDKDLYSTVTLKFETIDQGTKLIIEHEEVPKDHLKSCELKWQQLIIEPIENTFGYKQQVQTKFINSNILLGSCLMIPTAALLYYYYSK